MPFSFDPQPGDNETQCARCSAIFHIELTRCPECGINLYEPDDQLEGWDHELVDSHNTSLLSWVRDLLRRLAGKPYAADEVFGDALDQAFLYDDLLKKVGGDHAVVERLVAFEKARNPDVSRMALLKNAIQRWERDNRVTGNSNDPA